MFKVGDAVQKWNGLAIVRSLHDDWVRVEWLGLSPIPHLNFTYEPVDTLKLAYLGLGK